MLKMSELIAINTWTWMLAGHSFCQITPFECIVYNFMIFSSFCALLQHMCWSNYWDKFHQPLKFWVQVLVSNFFCEMCPNYYYYYYSLFTYIRRVFMFQYIPYCLSNRLTKHRPSPLLHLSTGTFLSRKKGIFFCIFFQKERSCIGWKEQFMHFWKVSR
jgi:hypothetical protein